jgi:hypothetical protein
LSISHQELRRVTQLPSTRPVDAGCTSVPVNVTEPTKSSRKRSFKAIYDKLGPYYAMKRVDPEPCSIVVSPFEKAKLKESWKVDVIWTIIRFLLPVKMYQIGQVLII